MLDSFLAMATSNMRRELRWLMGVFRILADSTGLELARSLTVLFNVQTGKAVEGVDQYIEPETAEIAKNNRPTP